MKYSALIASLLAVDQANALMNGWATTTRYWDCSGGACGCGYGNGQHPTFCHSNAMFKAPAGNKYGARMYGTAAISTVLGGGSWLARGCGKCFKLTGTGNTNNDNSQSSVVLMGTNWCPEANDVCNGKPHFDIAAPSFDFPGASRSNTCAQVDSGEDALRPPQACSSWPNQGCDCNRLHDPVLQDGCRNFLSLNWNNPGVNYEELGDCPPELHVACWKDNGGNWPSSAPPKCKHHGNGTFLPEEMSYVQDAPSSVSSCPLGDIGACMKLCPTEANGYKACTEECERICDSQNSFFQ